LDSYKSFVKAERERLQRVSSELGSRIDLAKSEMSESMSNTMQSNFSANTENIEEIRKKLAETSIELEEHKEKYKRVAAKKYKDIEGNNV